MAKSRDEQTCQASKRERQPSDLGFRESGPPERPVLRFSPTAWAKLLFFRDRGQTEIGGFGISRPDDLLWVQDFATVEQNVSGISVAFEDEAVADFFDAQVDRGGRPEQFARIWLHSHPGSSAQPSGTDEETFQRVFGRCEWAVLFILAKEGKTFARLRFNVGPGGHLLIPAEVDYTEAFGPSNHEAWEAEYQANINRQAELRQSGCLGAIGYEAPLADCVVPEDWLAELEAMDPEERQYILHELAGHESLWEGDGNEP